jgi:hypothetical protein
MPAKAGIQLFRRRWPELDSRLRGNDSRRSIFTQSSSRRKLHYINASALEVHTVMSFILFLIAMYWLPTLIAIVRQTHSALGVAMINFFLGWTVIGWFLALFWALAASNSPHVIVIENGRVVRS